MFVYLFVLFLCFFDYCIVVVIVLARMWLLLDASVGVCGLVYLFALTLCL